MHVALCCSGSQIHLSTGSPGRRRRPGAEERSISSMELFGFGFVSIGRQCCWNTNDHFVSTSLALVTCSSIASCTTFAQNRYGTCRRKIDLRNLDDVFAWFVFFARCFAPLTTHRHESQRSRMLRKDYRFLRMLTFSSAINIIIINI